MYSLKQKVLMAKVAKQTSIVLSYEEAQATLDQISAMDKEMTRLVGYLTPEQMTDFIGDKYKERDEPKKDPEV